MNIQSTSIFLKDEQPWPLCFSLQATGMMGINHSSCRDHTQAGSWFILVSTKRHRGFVPWPGLTKDYHRNGTNCPSAVNCVKGLGVCETIYGGYVLK